MAINIKDDYLALPDPGRYPTAQQDVDESLVACVSKFGNI
jgi:hypothetical protein